LFDVRRSLSPVADDRRCPGGVYVEPIVEMSERLAPPPSGEERGIATPAALRRFLQTYYAPGRRYRVLGPDAGGASVTIVKPMELSCVSVGACARLDGAPAGRGHFLATDSPHLATGPSMRELSAAESQRAIALAGARFQTHGLRTRLAQGTPVGLSDAIAVDLDGDGAAEMMAAAAFTSPRVAADEVPAFKATLAFLVDGRTGDVHELLTTAGDAEMGTVRPEIVGFVDADGNGVHEIVLRTVGYETWRYHLFRRVDGRWLEVYAGGGGGC
jgi:hypothetical protein